MVIATVRQPWKVNMPNLHPSPELAYVCGVILGDGYLGERHYKGNRSNYLIVLRANDADFVASFNDALSKVIGKQGGYTIDHNSKCGFRVRGQSLILYSFLKGLRSEFFKPVAEAFPSDFIRGLADSEGWVINSGRARRVEIALSTEGVVTYLQDLLDRCFGIVTGIHSRQASKTPHIKNDGSSIYSKKTMYCLSIYGKVNLEKFAKNIGFAIERKQGKLFEAIRGMGKARTPKRATAYRLN